jgi:hypothetical protein
VGSSKNPISFNGEIELARQFVFAENSGRRQLYSWVPSLFQVCSSLRDCVAIVISSPRREIFSSCNKKCKLSRSARDDKYEPFVHCDTVSQGPGGLTAESRLKKNRSKKFNFRSIFSESLWMEGEQYGHRCGAVSYQPMSPRYLQYGIAAMRATM